MYYIILFMIILTGLVLITHFFIGRMKKDDDIQKTEELLGLV